MTNKKMMTRRSALAAGVLTVAGSAVAGKAGTTGREQVLARNKAQVRRYYDEVFNKRDLSNAHEFLSPNLTINGRKLEGGYTAFYQNIYSFLESQFDEVMVSIDEMVAEGNTVAIRFRGTGIYYPGGHTGQDPVGVPFKAKGMGFYEFDEKGLMVSIIFMEDDEQIRAADKEYAKRQKEK